MAKKKIFIICGCGVATATAAEYRLVQVLKKHNIEAEVIKIRAGDTATNASVNTADLVVALTKLPVEVKVPVVKGIAFLTGVGQEEAAKQVIEILSK